MNFWRQTTFAVRAPRRGFHLITRDVLAAAKDLERVEVGFLQLFLQHTSASLTINENADPDVCRDLEASFDAIAPESFPYVHTVEGPDDMPAHVKSSLLGCQLLIPVSRGRLALGTWQGICLCEHRDRPSQRSIVLTIFGQEIAGDSGSGR